MGEISEIIGGGTPATSDDGNFAEHGIAWLTPADLTGYKETYIIRGRRDLSEQGYRQSAARLMPAGTVLFSSRAPIGYCAIAAGQIATNQGFKSFVLKGDTSPEYIRHYLRASVDYAESKSSGTTFKELSGSRAAEISVPLAPPPEQRRIVAKIDSLSAKSARARDHLEHLPRLIEKYKQAVLAAAYDGRLLSSANKLCRTVPISNLLTTLDQGWSPKCESEPASPLEWGVIKTTAIQPIHFRATESKRLPAHLEARPALTLENGDVLITRAGPRSRVAIACVVREAHPRLMLCDKAYRLRVKSETVNPVFVAYMLNAPRSLEALEQMKTGISDSGLNLTQSKFLALPIPDFTLNTQSEIVRRIETMFNWIDRLASETTNARKLIDHLDQAVLAKAFRGELVPQDPNDEPASVLLERIKSERATPQRSSGTRGRPRRTA
jgi:type I restriction enzyme S subunit